MVERGKEERGKRREERRGKEEIERIERGKIEGGKWDAGREERRKEKGNRTWVRARLYLSMSMEIATAIAIIAALISWL